MQPAHRRLAAASRMIGAALTLIRGRNGCRRLLSSGGSEAVYTNGWSRFRITTSQLVRILDRADVIEMGPEHAAMLNAHRAREAARRTLEASLAGEAA